MKTYNRPNSIAKACVPSVIHSEPSKAKRGVKVHWKATKARKAFTEILEG